MENENWGVTQWLEASGFTPCEVDEVLGVIEETQNHVDSRVYEKLREIAERRARVGQTLQPSPEFTTIQ